MAVFILAVIVNSYNTGQVCTFCSHGTIECEEEVFHFQPLSASCFFKGSMSNISKESFGMKLNIKKHVFYQIKVVYPFTTNKHIWYISTGPFVSTRPSCATCSPEHESARGFMFLA